MTLSADKLTSSKITDIEVLRGLAVFGVISFHYFSFLMDHYHSGQTGLLPYWGTWTGVDLFFTISGYVIGRSLLPQMQSCRTFSAFYLEAGAFWLRRIWRLLPSSWLWLLLALVLSVFCNHSQIFGSIQSNLWATLAGLGNYANFRLKYHFLDYGVSRVYWSLSLEEQFYLLFPLLVFVMRRNLYLLLIGVFLWRACSVHDYAALLFRTEGIVLGVLLALWQSHSSWQRLSQALAKITPVSCPCLRCYWWPCLACWAVNIFMISIIRSQLWR